MASLNFDVTALDRASQAFNRIADRIDFLVARLQALDHTNASPRVDVDTDPADRTLGRWAINFRRKMREALATIPTDIELRPDAGPVERTLARIRGEIADLTNERIGIDITAAQAIAQIEGLKRELRDLETNDADIEVRADVAAAIAALEEVLAEARRVDGTEATVRVKADKRGLKDIINAAALFQRSIAQFAKPIAIIGSIPGILSLTSSLVDLTGLLGLIPGLAAAAGAGIATLAIGMQGFGKALKDSGDAKKFAEDLKSLAPNAQLAAKAFQALTPAWKAVQQAVQNNLFEGISVQVKNLAGVLPTVRGGLVGMAGALNTIVVQWAQWATSIPATNQLGIILENARAAAQNLGPAVKNIAQALTDMAVVGARMLPGFAKSFTDLTAQFQQFIAKVTGNGQFEAWINRALDTLNQLGRIAGNAFSGLGAVLDAADASGASFLDTLEKMTGAFAEFANSAQGQQGLVGFFTTIRDIINGLLPGIASIGAALLGAFGTLGPSLKTAAEAIGDLLQGLSSAVPILAGLGANLIAPIATAAGALVNVLGPLPGIVLAAFIGFKTAPVILGAVATAFTFLAGAADGLGIRLLALGSASAIGGTMTALGTAAGVAATAFRAVATFLTGPFGIAILGAVALIGLLSSSNDDAAEAAKRHEDAVRQLAGSLDQSNAAITEATKQQIAMDLAQTKLATTGQSLATALQKNGVSFSEFAAAASGSDIALGKVNAQFVAVAESQAKSKPFFADFKANIDATGISLEKVTAAALGNVQAQGEIQKAYEKNGASVEEAQSATRGLVDQYRQNLDPALIEAAMLLGEHAGALDEAQAATRLAADATADWGARLAETKGVLQEFGNLIGANGQWDAAAAGAQNLAESFRTLGETAQASARNAAREVLAMGGSIEAAGAAAAKSVQQSRDEFLKMAESLGIPKKAAEELANALGLIPTAVELNIETNADETQAQLNEVAARLQALPKGVTELRVTALTDDAIKRLDEIGIKVERLKDGTFLLHLDDSEFQAKLKGAQDAAKGLLKPFIAFLDLDTAQADAKLNDFKTRGGAGNVAIPISFKHDVADQQLQTLQAQAQTPQVMPLQADVAAAQAAITAIQNAVKQLVIMPIGADPSQANAVLGALVGAITGTTATMTINAQNGPALAVLGATVGAITGTTATMTIDGNNGPAIQKGAQARDTIASFRPVMTVDSNPAPAVAKARAAVAAINAMKATITVTTNEIHRISTVVAGGGALAGAAAGFGGRASGGGIMRFASGGMVPGYAPGVDRIPALLSPGEAVLVPEAAKALGLRAIANLNRLASGGRHMSMMTKTGARSYWSYGTPGGRSGGVGGTGMMSQSAGKTYVLNVYNASNNEIDLREQFRKMEVLGV